MVYDAVLAERLRASLGADRDVTEQRMFGGVAFLVGGHLAVCASSTGGLLVRVAPEATDDLVATPHVHPFAMQGRVMKGWVQVDPDAVADDRALRRWIDRGVTYARSLPPGRPRP